MTKSTCCPAARLTVTDWKGASIVGCRAAAGTTPRPFLVHRRERSGRYEAIQVVLLGLVDQARLELVLHDRVRIPGRTLDIGGVELGEDVLEGRGARPVVRRPGERGIDRLLVPLDAGERILVLVLHAEHVPDLVQGGALAVRRSQIPSVDGGRLVQGNAQHVAADRRGRGTVGQGEADANLGLAELLHFLELQADAQALPRGEGLADHVGLRLGHGEVRVAGEEAVVQHRPVQPLRAGVQDGTGAAGSAATAAGSGGCGRGGVLQNGLPMYRAGGAFFAARVFAVVAMASSCRE